MKTTRYPLPDSLKQAPLAELHAHLGTSISPVVLWRIAHDLGIKLPKSEFHEFQQFVTLSPERRVSLNTYLEKIYHPVLDKLSSGTYAVEQATYYTMAGAYHNQHITTIELRNNPMRHNGNAEFDLDHIIMAMLRGMERALLENSQLSAGLIFCVAREFSYEQNAIIINKAIKFRSRGVIGIDVSGGSRPTFVLKDYTELFKQARRAGLKITFHTGEVRDANDMWEVLEYVNPDRIGHGIHAAYDESLMRELVRRQIVLEVCPLSNIMTKAVRNKDEMRSVLRRLIEHDVQMCINTDWPEVIEGCHLRDQLSWLYHEGMLDEPELQACNATAFAASFIPKPGGLEAYLA